MRHNKICGGEMEQQHFWLTENKLHFRAIAKFRLRFFENVVRIVNTFTHENFLNWLPINTCKLGWNGKLFYRLKSKFLDNILIESERLERFVLCLPLIHWRLYGVWKRYRQKKSALARQNLIKSWMTLILKSIHRNLFAYFQPISNLFDCQNNEKCKTSLFQTSHFACTHMVQR